jgi:RNA polymerase sigma factor (sigma-70 family)
MASKQTDAEHWLEVLRTNDRKGIHELYEQFLPRIVKYVVANQGREEEARDIFQEAILIIFKKAKDKDFKLSAAFFTYLYAVCRNLWLKRLEKKGKMRVTDSEIPELMDESEWELVIEEEERYRLFRSKFQSLSENCQQLLSLFFKKTPMKEIAEIMGFASVQYAKKRKFQCKEHLVALVRNDERYSNLMQ